MKKFVGKPYAGKPHVRFDEGVGKVFLSFPLYSTNLPLVPKSSALGKSPDIMLPGPLTTVQFVKVAGIVLSGLETEELFNT
jgi:hypothetical protein